MPDPAPRITRNTLLNVLGQGLPLVVGLAAIPVTAHALGPQRFGLLALIWAVLGYFGVLDLGLGRAATRFVADGLARGDATAVREAATLTAGVQTALGVLGGAAVGLLAPGLAAGVLAVPAALQPEAVAALWVTAAAVPWVALSLALRAILEGAQRFDLVNWIRAPSAAAVFLMPAVAAPLGVGLPGIVLLLLLARVATCWATVVAVRRALPELRPTRPSRTVARRVLTYGGWVGVSNVVSPLLTYAERFVLSARAGVAAVAYYAAPFEAVTRLLVVPSGLANALFPALGSGAPTRDDVLLQRWMRYLLVALGPPVLMLVAFAEPLSRLWLGPIYAARGGSALAVLGLGVLVNGLAHLPYVYLLARNRPDLPTMFHLIELPLYAFVAWRLVGAWGVVGAAAAWTLRVVVDAILLTLAVWKIGGPSPVRLLGTAGGRALLAVGAFGGVTVGTAAVMGPGAVALAVTAAAALSLAVVVWRLVLEGSEREACRAALRRPAQHFSAS
ncbi:MAG: flippase [Gemmatimonadales bacterium]